jgi:hypothetical protein
MVEADFADGCCIVRQFQYSPPGGTFEKGRVKKFLLAQRRHASWSVNQVAEAISECQPKLLSISHYLASIIVGAKSELLVCVSPPVFVTSAVIEEFASPELKNEAMAFQGVHNLLRSSDPAEAVDKLISRYIHRIEPYGAKLISASRASAELRMLLATRNSEARAITRGNSPGNFIIYA